MVESRQNFCLFYLTFLFICLRHHNSLIEMYNTDITSFGKRICNDMTCWNFNINKRLYSLQKTRTNSSDSISLSRHCLFPFLKKVDAWSQKQLISSGQTPISPNPHDIQNSSLCVETRDFNQQRHLPLPNVRWEFLHEKVSTFPITLSPHFLYIVMSCKKILHPYIQPHWNPLTTMSFLKALFFFNR